MKTLTTRILVGSVLIVLTAALLWLDHWLETSATDCPGCPMPVGLPMAILTALLILAGYAELGRLAAAAGMTVSRFVGPVCAVAIGTLPFWRRLLSDQWQEPAAMLLLAGGLMGLFAEQLIRHRTEQATRRIAGSLLAVVYLGVCAGVILALRIRFGMRALVLFLAVVKATDIGAYFTGTAIGRHKMIPWLSAGKTWEGLAGGLLLAAVAGAMIGGPAIGPGEPLMAWWQAAIFAAVLGLFGQGADLCESALKRDAGSKDSGAVLPAFGGVLDVLDSPLLSAPVGYILLLTWVG